ncbi:heavy metal translocating P-type ATPase [uncultured Eubacterium sp.]|uniref:heavy metal translocating P-type ATPase n=1 Tax=uncultured Eubacterium sp. TaxID=165185 RepID=UPI0025FBA8A7|nr:heavy metal translocating P-type ATPase [uncultured Eubacterium sp.]
MTKKQRKMLIRIIVSSLLFLSLVVFEHFYAVPNRFLRLALYMVPYLIISYDILKKAFKGIVNRQVFDENFLMAVASLGAVALAVYENGSYKEAVAVMLFYQIGELFQSYAVGKSRRSIAGLMDIRPDYANLELDGNIEQVSPDTVEVGSIIIVSAGEKIPIDGVLVEGSTTLDTSALTGESLPRSVIVGDEVISGCINLSGTVKIRTTKEFGNSTVSKILELVENASSKKSRSESFITRFARYYTPAVCIGAVALALIPPVVSLALGNPSNWITWIYRALTFLVISCPCALVISVPLSFFAGIGGASREGILVKGSTYIESLSKVSIAVFDKTGTLTKGSFCVTNINPVDIEPERLIELSAYAEAYSSHPISKSIKQAYGKEIDFVRIDDVKEISGKGVTAIVDGKQVGAGNGKLMDELCVSYTPCNDVGTVVYVAVDGVYKGSVTIADEPKETSKQAIAELKKIGVKNTVMLTGDADAVAKDVANHLGIDEVHSELLPSDKLAIVEQMLKKKDSRERLAFVGDGVNDAPVLSGADVGIAMGGLGSDAAIEAADVVLMDDDPLKLVKAIRLSSRCMRIVKENIIFALGIKALCLVLGAVGIANMWLAIFADVGVMVIAVVNAIRAMYTKKL